MAERQALRVADGGMETVLIFHQGLDLPCFASFPLLDSADGRDALRRYYEPFLRLAAERDLVAVLDTPTWRANADWGDKLGYSPEELARVNRDAVAFLREFPGQVVVSGCIGPRSDGYRPSALMSADDAERYHSAQVETFAYAGADLVTALTMTYPEEAIGIVRAARREGIPSVVSFTVETDGRVPSGSALGEAIELVDAETDGAADYFMLNCAHPTHFAGVLEGPWLDRLGGLRVNASKLSHAELDEAEELDEGDPAELAADHRELHARLPAIRVLGGCCGTDHRHVAAIADAWLGE